MGGSSAPAKSATELEMEKRRDMDLRKEDALASKRSQASYKRKKGRSILMSGNSTGIKDNTSV